MELNQVQLLVLQFFEVMVTSQGSHFQNILEVWEVWEDLLQIPIL